MELNRYHYFTVGVLLVLLGIQFRMIQSFVLNEKATQYLAQQFPSSGPQVQVASAGPYNVGMFPTTPVSRRTVHPPRWLGWSLISFGSVLILHSLAMKKPGG